MTKEQHSEMKKNLITLIDEMTENQLIYSYTFLSKMFDNPDSNKKEDR